MRKNYNNVKVNAKQFVVSFLKSWQQIAKVACCVYFYSNNLLLTEKSDYDQKINGQHYEYHAATAVDTSDRTTPSHRLRTSHHSSRPLPLTCAVPFAIFQTVHNPFEIQFYYLIVKVHFAVTYGYISSMEFVPKLILRYSSKIYF